MVGGICKVIYIFKCKERRLLDNSFLTFPLVSNQLPMQINTKVIAALTYFRYLLHASCLSARNGGRFQAMYDGHLRSECYIVSLIHSNQIMAGEPLKSSIVETVQIQK